MQKILVDYICCPICKGNLIAQNSKLLCEDCSKVYPIKNGIPMLLDLANVPDYITHQINYFEEESKGRPVYRLDPWQKSYLRRFFLHNIISVDKLILDIGCGSGYMAVELAKKGATVIASDLTFAQLRILQKAISEFNLEKKLYLVCCSAESLPFKNAIADVVIENAILEHLPDEKTAIDEITRVSKKRGRLMISVPHAYRYLWPFLIPINIWYDQRIGHIRRYTKENLTKKFSSFSLEGYYYSGNIFKFLLFTFGVLFKINTFDELAEQVDEKWKNIRYGATVITVFLHKNLNRRKK